MNWFIIAIVAQVILGTSAVFDKSLLKRGIFKPFAYTFWLGIIGAFALFIIPFSFQVIPVSVIILALLTGIIFILSMLFLFFALHSGEASSTLPIIGGFSPVFTLIVGYFLLENKLDIINLIGFIFLVLGGIVFFIIEKKELRWSMVLFTLASAVLFGFSNVLTKLVFDQTSFLTGFVWIKLGGVLFVLLMLVLPSVRKEVFSSSKSGGRGHHFSYFANRFYAGVGSVLVYVAISLTHPALVDATQSFKYVVIFFTAWFLLKEHFKGKVLVGKIIATTLIIFGLLCIGAGDYYNSLKPYPEKDIVWGVSFSTRMAGHFNLNPQEMYETILKDLKPKRVRLSAYWNEIEKKENEFDFSSVDWQIEKSANYNTQVILAFGMKAPRWPECHIPEWAKNLETEKREIVLRNYMTKLVEYYKDNPIIIIWQVENEPYLSFGECPKRGEDFLRKEVQLVKSIDSRPILTTDGGEFGLWYKSAREGDMFGTTMYRRIYSHRISRQFDYPLLPGYFRLKDKITHLIIGDSKKPFIVAELQAEPWTKDDFRYLTVEDQYKVYGPEYFDEVMQYARDTGFREYYLWGAEWWYWLKVEKNSPAMWNKAQELLK